MCQESNLEKCCYNVIWLFHDFSRHTFMRVNRVVDQSSKCSCLAKIALRSLGNDSYSLTACRSDYALHKGSQFSFDRDYVNVIQTKTKKKGEESSLLDKLNKKIRTGFISHNLRFKSST